MKILIVEDNSTDLKLAHSVLANAGHDVLDATSAEEAEKLLESMLVEVILTDLNLPRMDGLTMTKRLKHRPATATIPVIAMSSFADDFPKRTIHAAGFAAFLAKPINTRTLSRVVSEAVKRP